MVTMTTFCWHLAVSADPLSPPTVENLTAIGVCFPTCKSSSALETGPVKSVETLVWPFFTRGFHEQFYLAEDRCFAVFGYVMSHLGKTMG